MADHTPWRHLPLRLEELETCACLRLAALGIDTHADIHVAAALDRVGRVLGTIVIPTATEGANQLSGISTSPP